MLIDTDMSTLGGDWDNESQAATLATRQEDSVKNGSKIDDGGYAASLVSADIDEEDIEADKQRFYEDNKLEIEHEGTLFKCPDEFISIITPMEFEELVNLFVRFDANMSGTIDKHETKKILLFLGMDADMKKAEELLAIVDVDKSGEIDFEEFCNFIVMMKRGDERLEGFSKLLGMINSTPLGELERQAVNRGLKIEFVIVDKREATLTMPTTYIVDALLTGTWYTLVDGEVEGKFKTRKFQGMGNTTREAKYEAAKAALMNMGESMPGVKYKEGDFPDEWLEWIDENLLRGVDAGKVVSILATKGFHPHRNLLVMHRICAWNSLEIFLRAHPDIHLGHDPELEDIDDDFFEWVKETANRGIDGGVILKLLQDRCVDLERNHLHFAQKLKNNELGVLMGKDSKEAAILDFHHACKCGYLEEVTLYCKCGVNTNQLQLDRHTSQRWTPLMYAADGGHALVCKMLLEHNAQPNVVDLRGRRALHYAAAKGHTGASAVLVEGGTQMFSGDMQCNTPLHLAAMGNHIETVDYLAFKGLELTRLMTSDKVTVKKGETFDSLTEKVYTELPTFKLTPSDTVRFEKVWLSDAANMMLTLMDDDVKHMLAPACPEIMHDVLARFDPRPETGVFVTATTTGEQIYIRTIPSSTELSILLKYTFRQSALDAINNWKRSALHLACDANHIKSHEELILRLVDYHGCNVVMRDIHNCRPIDLLIKDKFLQNMPSSTQIREELIIDRRDIQAAKLFSHFAEIDRERTEKRRREILDSCIARDAKITLRLWHCFRTGSIFKKMFGGQWEQYEDPDSGNYFITKLPSNRLMGDDYAGYTWNEPKEAKALIDRTNGINYLTKIRSTMLRQCGEWIGYRCNKTNIEFYYNINTEELTFKTPKPLRWRAIIRESVKTGQRLGYGNEWEVMQDKYGNEFYRNNLSRMAEYDRPHDAVEVTPAEMLCTAYQYKGRSVEQRWFSCEQCNRAWKTSGEGSARTVKICEPCVIRCHKGHKGVRFIRNSAAICICSPVCRVVNNICRACVVSDSQKKVQAEAIDHRAEKARQKARNETQPPVFALVPRYFPDGQLKHEGGWTICRLCTTPELQRRGDGDEGSQAVDDGELLVDAGDAPEAAAIDSDTESSLASQSILEGGSWMGSLASDDMSLNSTDIGGNYSNNMLEQKDGFGSGDGTPLLLPSNSASGFNTNAANSGANTPAGHHNPASPMQQQLQLVSVKKPDMQIVPADGGRKDLPLGWIECYDVEEPYELKYQDQVLCMRYSGPPREYGRVKLKAKEGFYKIQFDNRGIPDEILERSYIELISRRRFLCNISEGKCAWTVQEALENPIDSQSRTLTGSDWFRYYNKSNLRRTFGDWDEMYNPYMDVVFYLNVDNYAMEKAVLHLQSLQRSRMRRMRPHREWKSISFTFDTPEHVAVQKLELQGWAYLRRRSINIGEFLDSDGHEWEEYMDRETSEYFYWQEQENLYRWDKPDLYQRKTDAQDVFKEGDEVMYRFPGRRLEEIAVVLKQRFDDETGEDMYDIVHKYNPELKFKWIARMHIKHVPKEGDALKLAKLEVKWKTQLRRQREADERKAKREKELMIAAELKRLENMKTLAYRLGKREDESEVGQSTRIRRQRMARIELEAQEVREEIDAIEGKARRDLVFAQVEELRLQKNLTRSEVLSITRSLELKQQMIDKVNKRNAQRRILLDKRKEAKERAKHIEEQLREQEIDATTPRSMVRRRIIRRVHIGMKRQAEGYMICQWGCGDWFKVGHEQADHEQRRCVRRIMPCTLGCPLKHTEEYWLQEYCPPCNEPAAGGDDGDDISGTSKELHYGGSFAAPPKTPAAEAAILGVITNQQYHETEECPKRLVICPKHCLEWVRAENLEKHLLELCTKRPAEPIFCRLGCEKMFGGKVETLIQAEDERIQHENEECEFRQVRCNWKFDDGRMCASQMRACDRAEHRDYHLNMQGIITYSVAGTYLYRVPKNISRLKVQLWGGGGGSGFFYGRQGGNGGGGSFVEAIIHVEPFNVLELTVGSGGGAGVNGTEEQGLEIDDQRVLMQERREIEIHMPKGQKYQHLPEHDAALTVAPRSCGVTLGGVPGGGEGYGGGGCWASGGGGGFSSITRRTNRGTETYLVAAGGGGGASLPGLPGAAFEGTLPGTMLDPINGGTATAEDGGKAGESGSTFNAEWPATPGEQWQGGNGCEFGAGGGGGYFGGGGGGTMPGISGAGGGGSCYVYPDVVYDQVVVMGHDMIAGGQNHNPPQACGIGEWDKVPGNAGQGGEGDMYETRAGNNGAIRLIKPGHY